MSGSLTRGCGENVPGIPDACAPAILRIWQETHYSKTPIARGATCPQTSKSNQSRTALSWWIFKVLFPTIFPWFSQWFQAAITMSQNIRPWHTNAAWLGVHCCDFIGSKRRLTYSKFCQMKFPSLFTLEVFNWQLPLHLLTKVQSKWNFHFSISNPMTRQYSDVIMDTMASQITSLTIVNSTVYSSAEQRKHQSSASLAFCVGNSPGTGEFPAQMASYAENVSFDDVIMLTWKQAHVGFLCSVHGEPQRVCW